MNIREANSYLEELSLLGSNPGLSRITDLCDRLGNPQDELKFIHVAGTNGKGSVCTYIYNIVLASGMKAGMFTSPAVMEYRERYKINGRNVSQAALCRALEEVKKCADEMTAQMGDGPTLFEVETALAFMLFREAGCEVVVLECGMGGESDSTNVIKASILSVITSISMDHTAFLGRNIEQIAKQKAGIIKPKGHVVIIEQPSDAMNVIKAKCSLQKADLTIVYKDDIKNSKWGLKTSSFDYGKHKHLKINMSGMHQTENAALAVAAVTALRKEKIKIEDSAIEAGLLNSMWPGRFEIISRKPLFIIDGAHNEDAAKRLAASVDYFFHNEKEAGNVIFIYGVLADKNYDAISKIMAPYASHIITVTPPDNPRALPAADLAANVSKYNSMVTTASSVTEALEMAYLLASDDAAIIAFGSLSYLGEIVRQVECRGKTLRKRETKI